MFLKYQYEKEGRAFDIPRYFRLGGQIGVETKRGCPRSCIYCADHLSKGCTPRLRDPRTVADEFQSLLDQSVDTFHLCDSEFNLPPEHARAVCQELIARRLAERIRWYAYLAVTPFDDALASLMRRAGCLGINFTGDSASPKMLAAYAQPHRAPDLANAVNLCRKHSIRCMIDLLLGGPGETPESLAETISFIKTINPDCAGASLGVRIYPHTPLQSQLAALGPLDANPDVRRTYEGPVDLFRPTFFLSRHLGSNPARRIRSLIADDPRFFPPEDPEQSAISKTDHNYNANTTLSTALAAGAKGAYWDILSQLKCPPRP